MTASTKSIAKKTQASAADASKRGAELLQTCQTSLSNVEQQVRILTDASKLAPFNADNAASW